MKTYNRIMELFWLSVGTVVLISVTFLGIKEGFSHWAVYYIFGLMALGTFVLRRFMRKRMEKHQEFLKNNPPGANN